MGGSGGGGGFGGGDEKDRLLSESPTSFGRDFSGDDFSGDDRFRRTGTLWTGVAHIITAVVGSGVLTMAWSTAQLGWAAGPLCLLLFGAAMLILSFLLADCYRSPDPDWGPHRNRTYMVAVKSNLDGPPIRGMYGNGVAYTITTAASVRAILKSNCYHREGHDALCEYDDRSYMLIFGAVQVVLSQIPDFHNMAWLSIVAAAMSFSYSSIGFSLSLAKVLENGTIKGSIGGAAKGTAAEKVWRVGQALGDILASTREPDHEEGFRHLHPHHHLLLPLLWDLRIRRFGSSAPGNLLTGFGFYEPYWLVDFANACVILHLVGAYQPTYIRIRGEIAGREPLLRRRRRGGGGAAQPFCRVNLLRVCLRTAYVALTTMAAMVFPYFNKVLAVTGAFSFWPLMVYFPVEMSLVQRKTRAWTGRWVALRSFSLACFLVSAVAFVGSLQAHQQFDNLTSCCSHSTDTAFLQYLAI
ncbi:unnamed protein product [Spirodela intermedia]|uniref:Amino acid transporter transmembrane domain-containing protein n=1 Tax=Spirodela intermedia TaxID=51605 RepID=A0A7I8JLU5_SPIIN|nr:unnamed protein product [Spirodela intermedia]CAA6670761.1 unnamed protein product [Spirodela intermedia]